MMRIRSQWWLGAVAVAALAGCAGTGGDQEEGGPADPGPGEPAPVRASAVADAVAPVRAPAAELARMKELVDQRIDRASVRRALQTKAGRRVDCVDIMAQPAFRNPRLRGQKLEQPPQELGARPAAAPSPIGPEPLYAPGAQAQAQCPAGTVPIPEVSMADLGRFASLDDFFAKTPAPIAGDGRPRAPEPADGLAPPHYGPTAQHQYAHAYRYVTNWGAETSMSINSLGTELNSEFSLGQIWVVAGSGSGLQTLEAGIQHYRDLYGDHNPHLFIYSTRGNYAPGTGCYNNTCGDFVQVSSTWFPGQAVGPVSTIGGAQYELNMHWAKAGDTGAWWLSVQGEWVGYYPRSLYTAAANHASVIDYGGEIIDNRNGGRHTMTDMGSGEFAAAGWTRAAFMRLIRYNDSNPSGSGITWAEATGLTPTQSDAACYSIWLTPYEDASWHWYFWYGGPGYANPACL
ncbi:MAG TPA: neprosin family prolyl endopeptidase [Kofleriaceae bacterium]|nr:neprosin family prolyl endopeptidase [Kofleriaceae bacterium]